MVEALNGAAHAKTAFWPLEINIILYGINLSSTSLLLSIS